MTAKQLLIVTLLTIILCIALIIIGDKIVDNAIYNQHVHEVTGNIYPPNVKKENITKIDVTVDSIKTSFGNAFYNTDCIIKSPNGDIVHYSCWQFELSNGNRFFSDTQELALKAIETEIRKINPDVVIEIYYKGVTLALP